MAAKQPRGKRIREWVQREFPPALVDQVTDDLIDVAAGNREGNAFEKQALRRIFTEDERPRERTRKPKKQRRFAA